MNSHPASQKIFCPYAFNGLMIWLDGSVSPCWRSGMRSTTKKGYEQALSESFQTQELQQLRQDFENGIKPESCGRCWEQESQGQKSERLRAIARHGENRSSHLEFLSPSLGNKCERTCLQCGSTSSSTWSEKAKALVEIPGQLFGGEVFESQNHHPHWHQEDLAHLKELFLFSTESMHQDAFYDFLTLLDKAGTLEKTHIHLETSGGFLPAQKLWPLLDKIQHLGVAISIDGMGDLNHFIRHPSPWNEVQKTVHFWRDLKASHPNWEVTCDITLTVLNTLGLDSLYDWVIEQGLGEPHLNEVHYPWYLSLDILSLEQRKYLAEKNEWTRVKKALLKERAPRDDMPPQDLQILTLQKYLQQTSTWRELKFQDVQPELHDLYFKSTDRLSFGKP